MRREGPASSRNRAAARAREALALGALAALVLAACDERPPPPPRPDVGPFEREDAGPPFDAGARRGERRPDGGARLPPADLEVVLPYLGDPVVEPLGVEGEVGRLDVFFSIDTTGSFGGEIDNLQADLNSRIVPALRDRVADVAFGVGRFEDFPAQPFGAESDRPFRLLAPITDDDARVGSAVASLDQPLGDGADSPEAGAEALYQIATGEGYPGLVPPFAGDGALGDVGGVGYRGDALRVVVQVSDAPTHPASAYRGAFEDTHSLEEAIAALRDGGIRALGIASGPQARSYLDEVALATGAAIPADEGRCRTGVDGAGVSPVEGACPLVFDINEDGSGLADAVVDAIADLLASVRYEEVWAEADDAIGFVRALEAVEATPPDGAPPPDRADRRPPDGVADTFLQVAPGTRMRFEAVLRNERIPPADYDQIFNLTLRVVGDGVTLLSRRVRVIVPRGRPDAGAPDAGAPDAAAPDAAAPDAAAPDAAAPDAAVDAG